MASVTRFVGLDVHQDTIVIAVADEGRDAAKVIGSVAHEAGAIKKALSKLGSKRRLLCCYEAGPTGYGLYRLLNGAGISCVVIAPSLTPKKSGVRVKTDRRDAATLAHFLRSGDLTAIVVPDEATEAIRDLTRARYAAKRAERAARHQLQKFLLRHSRRYHGGRSWTLRHRQWLGTQQFEHPAQQRVLLDYLHTVEQAGERVEELTKDLAELVEQWSQAPLVCAMMACRGIELVTAASIAAELGDMSRFLSPRELMAYVGLVPSERSSGVRCQRGGITKTGNEHVRRLLVEAAWAYRHRPRMTAPIRKRNERVSEPVRKIAWKAQRRLHQRLGRLLRAGKSHQQAITAVARELAGFLWAIAQEPQLLA